MPLYLRVKAVTFNVNGDEIKREKNRKHRQFAAMQVSVAEAEWQFPSFTSEIALASDCWRKQLVIRRQDPIRGGAVTMCLPTKFKNMGNSLMTH